MLASLCGVGGLHMIKREDSPDFERSSFFISKTFHPTAHSLLLRETLEPYYLSSYSLDLSIHIELQATHTRHKLYHSINGIKISRRRRPSIKGSNEERTHTVCTTSIQTKSALSQQLQQL